VLAGRFAAGEKQRVPENASPRSIERRSEKGEGARGKKEMLTGRQTLTGVSTESFLEQGQGERMKERMNSSHLGRRSKERRLGLEEVTQKFYFENANEKGVTTRNRNLLRGRKASRDIERKKKKTQGSRCGLTY